MPPDPIAFAEIPAYRPTPAAPASANAPGNLPLSFTGATNSARAIETPLAATPPLPLPLPLPLHDAGMLHTLAAKFTAARSQARTTGKTDTASVRQPTAATRTHTAGKNVPAQPGPAQPQTKHQLAFLKKFGSSNKDMLADSSKTSQRPSMEETREAARKIDERQAYKAFSTVYGANGKYMIINEAIRNGRGYSFDTKTVLDALASSDNQFMPTANERCQLKSFCKSVTSARLDNIDNYLYQSTNPQRKILYRGQDMTKTGIKQLRGLMDANVPLRPTHFFSCDASKEIARQFARCAQADATVPILFKIDGFSSRGFRGGYTAKECSESLFSTRATFKILSMDENKTRGYVQVALQEVLPSSNSAALPY